MMVWDDFSDDVTRSALSSVSYGNDVTVPVCHFRPLRSIKSSFMFGLTRIPGTTTTLSQ